MAAKKKAKRKNASGASGRAAPNTATPELIGRVLAAISTGASLRVAAEQHGIAASTALKAIDQHGMSEQYARAREERADSIVEEMVEIADIGSGDVQRDRLRFDARKWFASKLNPKKYADKVAVSGDGDGGAIPVSASVTLNIGFRSPTES